jgi:biopolymer transport protein ExbD/DNA-directed RNA polymerase subunit RPC12/RpoP
MSTPVVCPTCGKTYHLNGEAAGRAVRCRACDTRWVVGTAAPPSAAAPHREEAEQTPLLPAMRRGKHDENLIDMTAMVDIVFFLLIFFLVTSLKALESVMDMPTPESSTGAIAQPTMSDYQNDANVVMVRIEGDDSITIEDAQVFGDDEMRSKLRAMRQDNPAINSAMIVGSADASHGAAVRVFDACAAVGLNKPIFTVEEDE